MIKLIRNFWSDSKITSLHVNYENQKMKVKLATQLFSQSVANAIEYYDVHLSLPQFKNSAATTNFLKLIDNTFDILNSRNMNVIGFKKGLKEDNFLDIIEYLQKSKNYLLNLKNSFGKLLVESKRKTGFLGLVTKIESLNEISKAAFLEKNIAIKVYFNL